MREILKKRAAGIITPARINSYDHIAVCTTKKRSDSANKVKAEQRRSGRERPASNAASEIIEKVFKEPFVFCRGLKEKIRQVSWPPEKNIPPVLFPERAERNLCPTSTSSDGATGKIGGGAKDVPVFPSHKFSLSGAFTPLTRTGHLTTGLW